MNSTAVEDAAFIEQRWRDVTDAQISVFGDFSEITEDRLVLRWLARRTAIRAERLRTYFTTAPKNEYESLPRLLEQPPSRLARAVAANAFPNSEECQKELVEMLTANLGRAALQPSSLIWGIAFVGWYCEVLGSFSRSYPAIPFDLVRPLAQCLSGECTFRRTEGGWDVLMRGVSVGRMREHQVYTRPRPADSRRGADAPDCYPAVYDALGSTAVHRVLRELVALGWENLESNSSVPALICIDGGWKGLALRLGFRSGNERAAIARAGRLLSLLDVRGNDGVLRPILEILSGPGLRIQLINELRPGVVRSKDARTKNRHLVPLPPHLPLAPGHKLAGRAYSYQLLLLREMRHLADTIDNECVQIPAKVRQLLADAIKLDQTNRESLENLWIGQNEGYGLSFLTIDDARVGLGFNFIAAWSFLEAGGALTLRARKNRRMRKR